jgi:hypothetical protein
MTDGQTIQQMLEEYNVLAKSQGLKVRKSFKDRADALKALATAKSNGEKKANGKQPARAKKEKKAKAPLEGIAGTFGVLEGSKQHKLLMKLNENLGKPVTLAELMKVTGTSSGACLTTIKALIVKAKKPFKIETSRNESKEYCVVLQSE